MSDTLNQLLQPRAGALPAPVVANPLAAAEGAAQAASTVTGLRQRQFDLQQAQLQPAYQSMRMLMATNPNPSWDDVNAALAQSARIGGNVDGLAANATEIAAKGGKPADFMRATALGGMSPENQAQLGVGTPVSVDTGGNIVFGTRGGVLSSTPGQFTGATSIQKGFTPSEAGEFIQVPDLDANGKPTGTYTLKPRGTVFGTGVPGGGGGGDAAGGGGGGDINSLPKAAFLQAVAQRESGGDPTALNYVAKEDPTAYARGATASGKYQMVNSTWQQAALLAGVDTRQYPTAMSAPEAVQDKVASALYDQQGTQPWQKGTQNWVKGPSGQYTLQSVPQGQRGGTVAPTSVGGGGGGTPASGAFVGATSAQPVAGSGSNVQQAGGIQQLDPTGRPIVQGGGGGGGPVLHPPAPWMGPIWEQSAKEYSTDVSREAGLASRIQPFQSAISIINAHPDLKTGPTSQQWNNWASTLSQWGVQLPSQPGDSTAAYQELSKALHQGLVQSGAFSGTDMARLEAEASSPNIQQNTEAIRELSARQIGYERFQMARLKQFRSLHPGDDPDQSANQYRSQTSQWASNLDPVAFGADNLTPQEITTYRKGLTPQQDDKFLRSIKEAHRLYPEITPGGQ